LGVIEVPTLAADRPLALGASQEANQEALLERRLAQLMAQPIEDPTL